MTIYEQLRALKTGCAVAPIDNRAFLRISGPDATRWLNGMVTNNIKDLAPGQGCYNFLLNAQGRIQADCIIYREPTDTDPAFLLETGNWQLATVREHLDKFIIMDDVELSVAMQDKLGLRLIGNGARATLDCALIWPTEAISVTYSDVVDNARSGDEIVFSLTANDFEVWGNQDHISWVQSIGNKYISPDALTALRILSAEPLYGTDILPTHLPQETQQTHALHFAKGCYLGQEIVERIRSRGQVHRLLTQFRLDGPLPDQLPAAIEANGKPVGELTSAVQIDTPTGPLRIGLGMCRREATELHQTITYAHGTATPTTPAELWQTIL